ncbi:MAG TPA: transcription elongation factor GreB [Nitrospirae bacterium]|nr:transcription elongation factor GreB [bacterium BMS3Abin09]GBE41445.1 transcription elongation factor GreB [bacterium BMS3Bbin09]HDH33909.1 transcription elongation factor GreB [Nitrospirota bacterium]HDN94579.1 transcription elongation factor GreB [Nitrospirota bacterium]HDO67664.1 transcription elongation factor GreB [Nitrospirota bacterium]
MRIALPKKKKKVSNYITPEGQKTLSKELTHLWKTKRPKVVRAVTEAAAMGDRSENAEYIEGKKLLRQIDSRMRFLQNRLNELTAVDRKPADTSKVFFGAWVELEDEDGNTFKYRIVGPDEIDPDKNFISIDSPMAKALIGKTEDDEVEVRRPNGTTEFTIISIRYM